MLFLVRPTGPLAEEVIREDLIYRNSAMFDDGTSLTSWGASSSSVHASMVKRDIIQ